jgi:predicted secreted protein
MPLVDWAARSLATTILAVLGLAGIGISVGVLLRLTIVGSFALYFVIWWTIVFAILPIRIRTQAEAGEIAAGTEPGAPAAPALRERAIWTTIAADIVFATVVAVLPLGGL